MPVGELVCGIQVIDQFGHVAFGTNTTLLKRRLLDVEPGRHHVQFTLRANLPEGRYTAGFAFIEKQPDDEYELAWYDNVLTFHVRTPQTQAYIGYCDLPIEFAYQPIIDTHDR